MATVSCSCEVPAFDEVRTGAGALLAVRCRRCGKLARVACRVCRQRFKHLKLHFLRNAECARFDREGMWWTTDRPPTARAVFP